MRKLLNIFLCFSMALAMFYTMPAKADEDFAGHEDEYYELCKSDDLTTSEIKVCRSFKSYLADNKESLNEQIKANEEKIKGLNLELDEVYELIHQVSSDIAKQEDKIEVLEADIARLQKDIESKDTRVRDRMYAMQSQINSNIYLEFIMGASSIDDFFSRISSIDELTEYDHDLIKALKKDQEVVVEAKKDAEEEKANLVLLQNQQDALADRLKTQIEEMLAANAEAEHLADEMTQNISDISDSIEQALVNNGGFIDGPASSAGFSIPVEWGIVTAANWAYPSGGVHLGMDIGGRFNSPLYAPCDGVVIYMGTGCASDGGYLGNWCGGGAGNYLVMLSQMNGTTYGIKYLHMMNYNYIGWTPGSFVTVQRGQVVGYMGHSGNSTGTHVHIEIFNLGPIGYTEAARLYANTDGAFGLGYSGYALETRCESYSGTPCREEASSMFGYSIYETVGG